MATLTVRNLPEPVAKSLRQLAKHRGTSVEQQVRDLLCEAMLDGRDVHELIRESWKRQTRPTTLEEIQAGIREGRK